MMTTTIDNKDRLVGYWLMSVAVMVFVMVVIGGLTRLTGSGLSMVDWRPITGWLPPVGAEQWQAVFELYRQSPEYLKVNAGMSLEEFKGIFWLEFFHRLWGRVIGLAFGLPLIFFALRGWISRSMLLPFIGLFILGGAQGVLGWYMVQSGLVNDPQVSQYRLMSHLGFAFVLFGALVWTGLCFLVPKSQRRSPPSLNVMALLLWAMVFMTILAGALVAGLHAGLTYNTFPLMDGEWVPSGLAQIEPWYLNHFENITAVQFQHRVLAIATLVLALLMILKYRDSDPIFKRGLLVCGALVVLQALIGIATLLMVVPISMASLHQAFGLLVFTALTWFNFTLRR